jgi:hypothetical protein
MAVSSDQNGERQLVESYENHSLPLWVWTNKNNNKKLSRKPMIAPMIHTTLATLAFFVPIILEKALNRFLGAKEQ